jgi:hypothetical protein
MKNYLKYISMFVFLCAVTIACRDEEAVRFPDLKTGASARLVLAYPERSFINLDDLSTASLAFDIYTVTAGDIDNVTYMLTYVDADSSIVYEPVAAVVVTGSDFVGGKATEVEVTATELVTALGLDGGLAYLEGGDSFTFDAVVTLKDGRVFDASNSAPSITGGTNASFTTQFSAFVGCASPVDDITGTTYTATIHTEDSGGGPPFGLPDANTLEGVEITFKGPEPFRYEVSSHDAGWWARPDITATEGGPADFYDICGNIIMQPKASFGYGGALDNGGGTYDPATGIITMNWYNSFNDIYGFVTYVPE